MEMHQIRYFLAVAEALNFTRAAETCIATQPALTRAIRKLAEEMEGPLFCREGRHTHLSELGRMVRLGFEQALSLTVLARRGARLLANGECRFDPGSCARSRPRA